MNNFRWWKTNTHFSEMQILFDFPCLFWTEIVHCRRNILLWIERKYLGLCVFCMCAESARGQDKFLNQQSRESKRQLQQVIYWVHEEQCSLKVPSLLGCRRILGACFSCQSFTLWQQPVGFLQVSVTCTNCWQTWHKAHGRPSWAVSGQTIWGHVKWPYLWATESDSWWLT